ncbi:peptidase S8/S53 domain-containing protein [Mycena floridula]|nr:peptidase S8/S53 domain-containing protein [Mycena floridula]
MRLPFSLVVALLAPRLVLSFTPVKRFYDSHNYYVLEHNPLGISLADIVSALNVELVDRVGELQDHWLVRVAKPLDLATRAEPSDPVLERFQQLRSIAQSSDQLLSRDLKARDIVDSVKLIARQYPRQRIRRAPPPITPDATRGVAERFGIQDPMFPKQWHLVNTEFPEHMMNVTGVWEMGYTGKGVISSLVDDGLDYTSLDLKDNFDAEDSYDFNDHTELPTPKLFDDHHGTRCAGQIAAGKNTACGVGIAYDSKVAGVRILSGPITDVDEAAALNYGYQNVQIYSCSWGPPDNGQSMEGPSGLIQKAVVNGINKGRGGKGSVFVFASGNGAAHGDQCNFDGYTNSIYSVTVSAIDYKGLHPYYSEPCAANMIVAYSSGSGQHIVTTDKGENTCSTIHGGTSAAAPNAVGVFALALQARTATGRPYSYKYGFGALDGYEYVKAAKEWKLVKPQAYFKTHSVQLNGGTMNDEAYNGGEFIGPEGVKSKITISKETLTQHNFETLEHINVRVWIDHGKRGDVEVELLSPNGIRSVLAAKRSADRADSGYPGWTFMSVKHWGENPLGDWTIKVSDQQSTEFNGSFIGWSMMFWGSSIDPAKAKLFELPPEDDTFPPKDDPTDPVTPTTSTKYAKPTEFLDPNHGEVSGENTNPAFPTKEIAAQASASATSTPTADEGWFSDLGSLVSSQKWFFAAIGAVATFAIGAGVFFWRRRAAARASSSEYRSLNQGGEEGLMTGAERNPLVSRPRTKELYDAFGEMSDDDDADEETRLRPESSHPHRRSEGLGFHSGFLDDDEPQSAGPTTATVYKDEPEGSRAGSPSGSWQHVK